MIRTTITALTLLVLAASTLPAEAQSRRERWEQRQREQEQAQQDVTNEFIVPYPHPVITEVLFNVPQGAAGDANGDGSRDAAGDEFVEIYNPHAEPIELRGYRLANWLTADDPDNKRGVTFTFPKLELEPGEVAVVFNAYRARIKGPTGSSSRAPRAGNPRFDGAYVFRSGNTSSNNAFNNSNDFVMLIAPEGEKIDAVTWGSTEFLQTEDAINISNVTRNAKGAVQRTHPDNDLWPHVDIDGEPFSPGRVPSDEDEAAETDTENDEAPTDQPGDQTGDPADEQDAHEGHPADDASPDE